MPSMKADRDWIEDFRVAYAHWIAEAMPLLEKEDYQAAFRFYPFDHLRELVAAGALGSLAGTHFSLMGYATNAADIAETIAPEIAEAMARDRVDLALLVPV